jgi:hypothetical protein
MESSTEQGSHLYVLTLQNCQQSACTLAGTYTPPPGATRYDILTQLQTDAYRRAPSMEGAVVLYFALEPNTV